MLTVDCSLPHPDSCHPKWVLISSDIDTGSETNHQPPEALCCQTKALNSYFTFAIMKQIKVKPIKF
jgi:hypothetical protein